MTVRITCINKLSGYHANSHEAISHYGWIDENGQTDKTDRLNMVDWMEKGGIAYVLDRYGNKAYCFVNKSINGTKFLQTHADGTPTDNLLSLPECL